MDEKGESDLSEKVEALRALVDEARNRVAGPGGRDSVRKLMEIQMKTIYDWIKKIEAAGPGAKVVHLPYCFDPQVPDNAEELLRDHFGRELKLTREISMEEEGGDMYMKLNCYVTLP